MVCTMTDKSGTILVIGGNGTIGKKLVEHLQNKDYNVLIHDLYSLDEANKDIMIDGGIKLPQELKEHNVKSVVHLGEMLRSDDLLEPDLIHYNLTNFAYVLRECGKLTIPVKAVTWECTTDVHKHSVLEWSLRERQKLIDHYNIGTSVITEIECAHIIDFDYPASNYMSIFNRIINGFLYNSSVRLDDCTLDTYYSWSETEDIIRSIDISLLEKNRDKWFVDINEFHNINDVISVFMDILGIETMEVVCKKEMKKFKRGTANANDYIWLTEILESEIDRLNATFERLNGE